MSLIHSIDLNKNSFIKLRNAMNKKSESSILPSYYQILKERKLCYPHNIQFSESSARVGFDNLIIHTVTRLLETISYQKSLAFVSNKPICFEIKYGFDGTTSNSNYKQGFAGQRYDDTYFFNSFMCPLSASCEDQILWKNPSPGGSLYCRPISINFSKESPEITKSEFEILQEQLECLVNQKIDFFSHSDNKIISTILDIKAKCTMVDGKVLNVLADNKASLRCRICKLTYKGYKGMFFSP